MTAEPRWPLVRSIHRFDEIDSTSDQAKRLLIAGRIETPALVWADRQTRGRGQGSNAWWSDPGSLTATIVLDPSDLGLARDREPLIALVTASAVVNAIERHYPTCRAGIRWPNDVEAGGRKLGGVLPERIEILPAPKLLIGIGLNVETRLEQAPEEVRKLAATLGDWGPGNFPDEPIAGMLEAILGRLDFRLRELTTGLIRQAERWNELDTLAGSKIRVDVGGEIVEGIAQGIEDDGGLAIRQGGETIVLHSGRVLRV